MKTGRKTKGQLVKELEALRKINATIGTLLDLKAVLQRIIDEIVPLFAAQAASVILFDYAKQESEITTAYGRQTPQGKPLRYPWRDTLSGWVVEHKRPLRLSRPITHEWQTSAKLAEQLGGSLENISVLLAPLWLNGEVLGCLEVVWDPQRDITNGDEQLLETIATQVAIAIANARLYTEQQRAEASLRDSERRLRRMVEHLPAGAVYREGESIFFNAAVERLTGYSNTEVWTIEQWFSCLYGVAANQIRQRYEEDRRANFPAPLIVPLTRKNGEVRFVEFAAYRSESSEVWLLYDVTERRHAEHALQESEERYRILSQLISDCAFSYRIEPNGTFFLDWLTDSFYRMTGYDPQEFFARPNPWDRLMSAEAAEQLAQVFQSLGPHGSIVHDFSIIRKDREVRWLRGYLHSVSGTRGAPVRIYGAVQDITERKHAEDALRQSEERYRIVSQCMSDYAFSFRIEDDKTSFMEWLTDSFTRVTGYPISDFLGKSNPWARYIHPQDLERVNATVRKMQPGVPTTYEFRIIRRDGETRWIRSYAYAVRGEKGSVTRLYGAAQDITERKHAEDMLRYQRTFEQLVANISKDFLNLAPEEIDQGVLRSLHMVGEFSNVDRGYVFLFHEDLATMDNTYEWCGPGIEPGQSRFRNIPTSTFPWFMKKLTDFEVIYIPEVSALPPEARAEKVEFQSQGIQSLISIPLVSGKTVIGLLEFATVRTTKRWTEESLLLLKVVGEIIVNALERKWASGRQQHLHAQLLQTQKLEAIGTLAGGIAHDFNNILAAIMGYTELATDDVPSESLTRRNLESVLVASRRARRLVQQLLTFSRPSHLDRRPVQLHKIVQNTLTLLRASFPKHIDIHLALQRPIDTIFADPNQIEQVVMNLCVNAAYAIGEHHGVLGIGIDYVRRERATDLVRPGLSIPAACCLTISDTGCGIAPETLAHIFEPFFTTKPVGQGSGMGLAIVHSIVTSHGGSIAVESHPGQGTTFRVYFPSFQEKIATDTAGTILLDQDLPP